MSSFTDHKLRFDLTNELHARPFPTFGAPGSVAFLALKVEKNAAARDKTKDTDLLIKLLDRFGAPHPQHGATHYSCLLYTSPSPRDGLLSRMPSSA